MSRYTYFEPDRFDNVIKVTVNEDYIIYMYWCWWKSKMEDKYGKNSKLITKKNCVEDFITVHWAERE